MQHLGRDRILFIGLKGQVILRPYLLCGTTSYCFCPAEAERKRPDAAHAVRVTPIV
jgi:hypothetical protein